MYAFVRRSFTRQGVWQVLRLQLLRAGVVYTGDRSIAGLLSCQKRHSTNIEPFMAHEF